MKKTVILLWLILPFILMAQSVEFSLELDPAYTVVERVNVRLESNGRYVGHVNRESRHLYQSVSAPGGYQVSGKHYILEQTLRDGSIAAGSVDALAESSFKQDFSGRMAQNAGAYPVLRNFPSFPSHSLSPGEKWEDYLYLSVFDPDSDNWAVIPLYAGYQYMGTDVYKDREVFVINAQYAVRYKKGSVRQAESFLESVQGKHVVSLMIDVETRAPVLLKDQLEEQWLYLNGKSESIKGFSLTFYEGISLFDRKNVKKSVAASLNRSLGQGEEQDELSETQKSELAQAESKGKSGSTASTADSDKEGDRGSGSLLPNEPPVEWGEDLALEEREEGIALTLKNLHFMPDKAVLLPEDRALLDIIAETLNQVPEKKFLVKGHTADIGSRQSQIDLSRERARAVIKELSARGIREDRFLYLGLGSDESIGDNNTDEGRKQNRRVEIIILD